MIKILPAILSKNVGDYIRKVKAAEKIVDEVQIDIIDNKFARNLTIGSKEVASIRTKLGLEIQLMVEFIEDWIDPFVKIKPKRIVVPIEVARDPIGIVNHLNRHQIEVGFSLNPESGAERLQHLVDKIDTALVLSVHPGFSGQHFVHGALEKIRKIKQMNPALTVEIDGAIEPGTARKAAEAGANLLCSGSFVFENSKIAGETYEDRVRNAYEELKADIVQF